MNYQYNIGCSLNNLKGIREFIRSALKDQGIPEIEMAAIILALDEMCSNLMIHAHHCNPDHLLEVHIDVPEKGKLIFEIIDDGNVFNINQFHSDALNDLVHEKRKGGLGIRLVISIMDNIEYISRDGKNICRLTKLMP